MDKEVAETSKELDPTTLLHYGVYPSEGRRARYYAKQPSDSAWAVEDAAKRQREPLDEC